MNKFIIVRHGQSEQHVKNITGGWSNVSLTKTGFIQVQKTGHKLLEILDDPFIFMSSDLLRAQQTALAIEKVIKIKPQFYQELRELNNGDAANLTREAAKQIYIEPTTPALDWKPYPNAESWRMMGNRISSFLNNTIDSNTNYLIISHANAIIEIINWYLKISIEKSNVSYDRDPCSITILYTNQWGERTIHKLNDTAHLE